MVDTGLQFTTDQRLAWEAVMWRFLLAAVLVSGPAFADAGDDLAVAVGQGDPAGAEAALAAGADPDARLKPWLMTR
jgi:hypothetical protein